MSADTAEFAAIRDQLGHAEQKAAELARLLEIVTGIRTDAPELTVIQGGRSGPGRHQSRQRRPLLSVVRGQAGA